MPEPDRLALMVSTLCFLGAFAAAASRVVVAAYRATWPHHLMMALGFLGQCWVLAVRGKELGRCPITQPWELLVFISWGVVMMYWVVGPAYRVSLMGIITAPLVWLFQVLALILHGTIPPKPTDSIFQARPKIDPWLEWHATVSLLAYAAFALAASAGILFLFQNRQLKSGHPHRLIFNLPPLRNLGRGLVGLLHVGFGLLTIGILSAYFMETRPDALKLAASWAVWAAYLLILAYQWRQGWPQRRLAEVAALIFLLPLGTLWIVSRH
jgi:ABC-type uncharacterized transport system permease subunit